MLQSLSQSHFPYRLLDASGENFFSKVSKFKFSYLKQICQISTALIVFTIARFRRLKTITNIFLASLATADLLLVTICVPVNVSNNERN